jgi:integrase
MIAPKDRKVRKTIKTEYGPVAKLANGRFRIGYRDSYGKRIRLTYPTLEEATAALKQIAGTKISGGEIIGDARNKTFGDALALIAKRDEVEGVEIPTRRRKQSNINVLRDVFGTRKLSEFAPDRLKFMQDWFIDRARGGKGRGTLAHYKTTIKQAVVEATKEKWMGPIPVNEWLKVPKGAGKTDRDPLTLKEISLGLRAVLQRGKGESELNFYQRLVLFLIGLFTGMRNGEVSGLHWGNVNFDTRAIFVRDTYRTHVGIVKKSTKTGKSGFRRIPMGPILFAALSSYKDRLVEKGYNVDDDQTVLLSDRTKDNKISPSAIARSHGHWRQIAAKAKLHDVVGLDHHSYYGLRHSAPNMWRAIGMPADRILDLMGQASMDTFRKNYQAYAPDYDVLRIEVEPLLPAGGRTADDYIDALNLVLYRRWLAEGIKIGFTPRPAPMQITGAAPLALPGNKTIELIAMPVEKPTSVEGMPKTRTEFDQLQRVEVKKLILAGWDDSDIMKERGIRFTTLKRIKRTLNFPEIYVGKVSSAKTKELREEWIRLRTLHPNWSATQIGEALKIDPRRGTRWERNRGVPMPHRPGAYKYGKYQERILQLKAEDYTDREVAEKLAEENPGEKFAHSGVSAFLKNIGFKSRRHGPGQRVELWEPQMLQLIAEGRPRDPETGRSVAFRNTRLHRAKTPHDDSRSRQRLDALI